MRSKKDQILLTILIISLILVSFIGINELRLSTKDREAIKQVIRESEVLADKVYIEVKKNYNSRTLEENKTSIIEKGHDDLKRFFTKELAQRLSFGWVEAQIQNVASGPEMINCGITDIYFKQISVKKNIVNVTAVYKKYLDDRAYKDGKPYRYRMEGSVLVKTKLIKENGQWKISEFVDVIPDFRGDTKHLMIPEN